MTNGIRVKVTPKILEGLTVHVLLEWVEIVDEQLGKVVHTEEFKVVPHQEGASYVSRLSFLEGEALPGTFWLDKDGKRHFVIMAEPGSLGSGGQESQIIKSTPQG